MTAKKPTATSRPTEQTPYGLLFADTEAFARYTEAIRIRDWLQAFLEDMEHLRIDSRAAIKRIDAFWLTLAPAQGSLKTEQLARIRACLAGNTEIPMGPQLTGLRLMTSNHWHAAVSSTAQDCERPLTGAEIAYTGPFPRKSGDQTPAYGYHRAMADGRY